jgi:hypothetical protein
MEAYTYRSHLITPIDGTTSYGQPKVRISGPIVNEVKAAENAHLRIDGYVNLAEREAVRAGRPPVIDEASRRIALAAWGKQSSNDDVLRAAYRAAFCAGAR